MRVILFEDESHLDLLPLTFTRPVFELRAGIFTARERWERTLGHPVFTQSIDYLGAKYTHLPGNESALWLNGKWIPTPDLLHLIKEAEPDTFYINSQDEILLASFSPTLLAANHSGLLRNQDLQALPLRCVKTDLDPIGFRTAPDLFRQNESLIQYDFKLITQTETSQPITDPYTRIYGKDNIFVSEGVDIKAATINAEDGLIYLGKQTTISEGAIIRRSHAICDHAVVNMGAKLRGDTTIGPHAKVGGEVANSVLMGYSNKGHEGYLGNSVIGYWCNLGADTNTSNLKNNYAQVKIWNYQQERFANTGLQFCGLIMGDHSKTAINTMFNTGTVVGVSANIFGSGFPRNFIPSFSWGGAHGFTSYKLSKAFEVAEIVMKRRKHEFDQKEQDILSHVYEETRSFRRWEKVTR